MTKDNKPAVLTAPSWEVNPVMNGILKNTSPSLKTSNGLSFRKAPSQSPSTTGLNTIDGSISHSYVIIKIINYSK